MYHLQRMLRTHRARVLVDCTLAFVASFRASLQALAAAVAAAVALAAVEAHSGV
ncbi:hypothetical protein DIPPA_22003 [Diplonema papillatum]|nr:hypothetical protein DIPPA_22003 [Diplonema papillatum]